MNWSPQQQQARDQVSRWLSSGGEGVFRLFGYAGTGKTTLAKDFADGQRGTTLYGAYTGKAAHVLQQKGCTGATTLHRLIYKPSQKSDELLKRLHQELEDNRSALLGEGKTEEQVAADPNVQRIQQELANEEARHRKLNFVLNEESPLREASLLVVDECSMVDQQMGEDILSFGVPVLVLGDPAQLPPVYGAGYFTEQAPDALLTEIHRQAKGNPILEMATNVREGRKLKHGQYGDSKVVNWQQVEKDEVMAADQVLVGTNKLRHTTNARIRELKGLQPGVAVEGDRVVCLRNNHEAGLLNGGLWTVKHAAVIDANEMDLTIQSTESEHMVSCAAHTHYFLGKEPAFWHVKQKECFDYGYCLTTHKSQGSQWDRVYIFDESYCFRADARRWLYTAITRAAKQVTVVTK